MNPILVVGGAGYIGSHMLLALRDAGYEAVVFDNLSRGHADAVGDVPLIVGDLLSPEAVESAIRRTRPAAVIHFAALAYVGESVQKPDEYYRVNVTGTSNLLQTMRAAQIDKLVFSSSCATYGHSEVPRIDERHPQHPINPYGRSKLVAEWMLRDHAQAYGLKSIALRYFNAAGADPAGRASERHDPETHLIPLVLQAARAVVQGNKQISPLQVFGEDFPTPDGTCIRDFVHVSDLCEAHLLALRRLLAGDCTGFEAYNLSSMNGSSVREVISACEKVTGVRIPFVTTARRSGDPAALVGDSSAARKALQWAPRFEKLEQIVSSAWARFPK